MSRTEFESQYHMINQDLWLNTQVPTVNEKRFESTISFEKIIFLSQFPRSDQNRSQAIEQLVMFLAKKIQEKLNAAITGYSVNFGMNPVLHFVGYSNFQLSLLTLREFKTESDKEEIINLLRTSIDEFHGGKELRLNEAILDASIKKSSTCSAKKIIVSIHPSCIKTIRNARCAIEQMDCEFLIGAEPPLESTTPNEKTVIHVERRRPCGLDSSSLAYGKISVSRYAFPEVPRESITTLPILMPAPKTQQSEDGASLAARDITQNASRSSS